MSLYKTGIVELVAWTGTKRGRIERIRRVDLSEAAAQALVQARFLPRCFLPVLVSPDLLENRTGSNSFDEDEILIEEFSAWLECGGLGAGALQDLVDDSEQDALTRPSLYFGSTDGFST